MDCPRCGVSTFADRHYCPGCGWHLSRPFFTTSSAAGGELTVTSGPPAIQTAADAAPEEFFLSPPRSSRPAGAFPRQRRGLKRRRRQTGVRINAVTPSPEAGQWQPPPRPDIVGVPLVQTSFDFNAGEQEADLLVARAAAAVELRLQAGLLDASLLFLAGSVFLGVFTLLGGSLAFGPRDQLVYLLSGFVLTSLYFGLFTVLGGRTPGMLYYGLHVLTFEGRAPLLRQALWRGFGYLVSTGSLLLGFLWALVDERHLTWHDHISRTFISQRSLET